MTWTAVSKAQPCPACGRDHWCGRDGHALHCMATTEPPAGFRLQKTCNDGSAIFVAVNGQPPTGKSITRRKSPPPVDPASEADHYAQALTPNLATELANDLGLPVDGFDDLGVGWCETRRRCTFPERDAKGRVIGIIFRDRSGDKKAGAGHKRGLSIPSSFASRVGTVLVVEGASDVLAATSMGYAAVGRSSNRAGGALLAELLRGRDVLVVGENDEKPDGDWPGRDGAKHIAAELARRWGRPVKWAMPPAGHKDVRRWYIDDETGADLLELLKADAQVEEPGGLVAKLTRDDADRKLNGIFRLGRTVVQTHVQLCRELADFMLASGREAMGDRDGPLSWAFVAAGLGITTRRVRQLVEAGQVWRRVNRVHSEGLGQLTERHLRPLAKLQPAKQAEVLEAACRIARDDHEIEQGRRREEGRRPTRLKLKASHVQRAVRAVRAALPPSDMDPDTMTPAAAALCLNESGRGESAREAARMVTETWQNVSDLPGAPRALVEALSMARQLAENWAHE